jgi:hypothetical protein
MLTYADVCCLLRLGLQGTSRHTGAHGLLFEIEAKDAPIQVTALRVSARAGYMRAAAASASSGAATLRVFFAAESGSRTFAATPSVTDNLAKEWRLLGEYVGAVPAAPMTVTIALQPLYLAPHQQVTVIVHSDQAFGIAVAVPSLVEMEREMAREARCTQYSVCLLY